MLTTPPLGADVPPTLPPYDEHVCLEPHALTELGTTKKLVPATDLQHQSVVGLMMACVHRCGTRATEPPPPRQQCAPAQECHLCACNTSECEYPVTLTVVGLLYGTRHDLFLPLSYEPVQKTVSSTRHVLVLHPIQNQDKRAVQDHITWSLCPPLLPIL